MAAIKPRRGTSAPTVGTILQNELAIDSTNKRIYIGAADGSGTLVGSAPGGSDTQVQFNDSGNLGGDSGLVYNKSTDTLTIGGNLVLNAQGDLRLSDSDSSNYVAFQAPATVANNNIYTLPSAVGSATQVLRIASVAGNDATLEWATASGGGTPGGSDTQVQFNDGGSTFGGDAGLTYNKTTDTLTIAGDLAVNGGDITSSASTFNLLNTTPETINAFDNATSVNIGKSTGTGNTLNIFGGFRFEYTSGMASGSNLTFLGNSTNIQADNLIIQTTTSVSIGDTDFIGNGTYLGITDAFQIFEFNNGNLDINGNEVGDVVLREYSEVKTAPTISSNTLTLSLSNTNFFEVSLNANINTLTISDCRATANTVTGFTLIFTADGTARTVTWPASVKWPNNDPPALTSTNGKKDILSFISPDNGTNWYGFIGGLNF